MSEQETTTAEETVEESVESSVETTESQPAADLTPSEPVVAAESSVVTAESQPAAELVSSEPVKSAMSSVVTTENKPAAKPAAAPPPLYDDAVNDNDEDEYDDYEDEEDDGLDARGRFGVPSDYVPSTQRGRSRRIHIDIKLEDLHYKNIPLLTRFLDTRGRILSRRKTGVSAKAQRRAVTAIKRARHLALLPYTAEHTRVTRLKKRG